MNAIVDLDDFCPENHRLPMLEMIRREIPDFKATLFTIMGRCSGTWLQAIEKQYPWLELVPHGWMHDTARECQGWSAEDMAYYLDRVEDLHPMVEPGFKAPGWQISDGCYQYLKLAGYWVADQAYNDARRPKEIKAYTLEPAGGFVKVHGHIGHMGGHNANELELIVESILKLKGCQFLTVGELMRGKVVVG